MRFLVFDWWPHCSTTVALGIVRCASRQAAVRKFIDMGDGIVRAVQEDGEHRGPRPRSRRGLIGGQSKVRRNRKPAGRRDRAVAIKRAEG